MAGTAVPHFFDAFPMQRADSATLDALLADGTSPLTILFLWGRDCVNCDIAKRQIVATPERFRWPQVRWLHDNVYDDPAMATRFGLHGVPTFLVFRGTRRMGRISPYPGVDPFTTAIARQIEALSE
jgi:hypothetical protein